MLPQAHRAFIGWNVRFEGPPRTSCYVAGRTRCASRPRTSRHARTPRNGQCCPTSGNPPFGEEYRRRPGGRNQLVHTHSHVVPMCVNKLKRCTTLPQANPAMTVL